jgi:hypothetical protein
MLLCLDREQRLTFILGAIFGVSDTVAAELLEITPLANAWPVLAETCATS